MAGPVGRPSEPAVTSVGIIADKPIDRHRSGGAWAASTAVMAGQYVITGGNTYLCMTAGPTAASGGPTGTGPAAVGDAAGDGAGAVD